jgi:hypothetical protein
MLLTVGNPMDHLVECFSNCICGRVSNLIIIISDWPVQILKRR